jgi:spermidine/putrescine transport system permease protein
MIEFRHVNKIYDDKVKVVDDISLDIKQGEFVVLIGPSGCGKSTVLEMMTGIEKPTRGSIYLNGKDIRRINETELRRNVGHVTQQTSLSPNLTIGRNIGQALRSSGSKGQTEERINSRTKELLKMVGMDPLKYMDRFPSELSGGQQQRIGIVRELAREPNILLMDEPFSALDPVTRRNLQDTRLFIILLNTLVIALLSSAISTAIGVLGALAITRVKTKRFQNALLTLNNVMIVSPDVIIGASFLVLFAMIGIKLGFGSVLISHIAFSVPIVVLMVLPNLEEMSPTLIDAARDLGASGWDVLTRVVIPYISPGIFAGFFMALTYSLDDFAVTFFVTGGGFSTLSVEIYSLARRGISLTINALSTLIFLATLILVIGYYFISKQGAKPKEAEVRE